MIGKAGLLPRLPSLRRSVCLSACAIAGASERTGEKRTADRRTATRAERRSPLLPFCPNVRFVHPRMVSFPPPALCSRVTFPRLRGYEAEGRTDRPSFPRSLAPRRELPTRTV